MSHEGNALSPAADSSLPCSYNVNGMRRTAWSMLGLLITVASLLAPLSTRALRFPCLSPLEWHDDLHGCYMEGWLPPRHGFSRPVLRADQLRDPGDVVKVSLSRLTDAL